MFFEVFLKKLYFIHAIEVANLFFIWFSFVPSMDYSIQ